MKDFKFELSMLDKFLLNHDKLTTDLAITKAKLKILDAKAELMNKSGIVEDKDFLEGINFAVKILSNLDKE